MRVDVRNPEQQDIARRTTVTVDGIDVTRSCFAADSIEGWADVYVSEPYPSTSFRVREDRKGLITTRLRGRVRLKVAQR